MKKIIAIFLVFILHSSLLTLHSFSQCALCKAAAESNVDSKKNQVGRGINKGVMYLLPVPYILVAIGGFILYKHRNKQTGN